MIVSTTCILEPGFRGPRRRVISESSNPRMTSVSFLYFHFLIVFLLIQPPQALGPSLGRVVRVSMTSPIPAPQSSAHSANVPFGVLSRWRVPISQSPFQSLSCPVTPPAQRVQFILGQESQDVEHETHPVFSEMEELMVGEDGNMEWKETARSAG